MKIEKDRFQLKQLNVVYHGKNVGTLATTSNGQIAFSYDRSWLDEGFAISPFSLPLEEGVSVPTKFHFDGLFGIFSDSLPDAWGRLLLSRVLKNAGMSTDITILDKLALVGSSGMGALEYVPDYSIMSDHAVNDLDHLASQIQLVLSSEEADDIDKLFHLAGSSGGARPKVIVKEGSCEWIIKFPSSYDPDNIGVQEYDYACCAIKCGIDMPGIKLFESKTNPGYFGIERFDRKDSEKIHMATAAAILEADFTTPCLDYNHLMKLTKIITDNSSKDIENMFRRTCFNVFAHNRDDHAKNFTYLFDEKNDTWKLSPAYDLTFSNTYYGEHTTTVDGNGIDPGEKELLQVGLKAGMKKSKCKEIIEQIYGQVHLDLDKYLN